jgi:hypothetical protein
MLVMGWSLSLFFAKVTPYTVGWPDLCGTRQAVTSLPGANSLTCMDRDKHCGFR